jgi:hypothetical protein
MSHVFPVAPEDSIDIPFTCLGCSRIWMKLFLLCSFRDRSFVAVPYASTLTAVFKGARPMGYWYLNGKRPNLLGFVPDIGSSLDGTCSGSALLPFRPSASETRKPEVSLFAHLASSVRGQAVTAASSDGDISFPLPLEHLIICMLFVTNGSMKVVTAKASFNVVEASK